MIILGQFSPFSIKTKSCGNSLEEAQQSALMSTYNIYFYGEIRKKSQELPLNT